MRSVAIVEAVSSGQMYIHDIIARGYHPIYVISRSTARNEHVIECRKMCSRNFGHKAEFLTETEDFDALISQLKERNTVICLPGSEASVKLAEKIATAEFLIRSSGFDIMVPTYYNARILAGFRQ